MAASPWLPLDSHATESVSNSARCHQVAMVAVGIHEGGGIVPISDYAVTPTAQIDENSAEAGNDISLQRLP